MLSEHVCRSRTPAQHRAQAARLRGAKDPKVRKLAEQHELLAKAIEARQSK